MSTLEKKLDSLIAQQDHVQPEDVTLEHIRKWRDQNVNAVYDFSTRYGGYNRGAGRTLSPAQEAEIVRAAYRFLSQFRQKKMAK
jgi:hypothetical protein